MNRPCQDIDLTRIADFLEEWEPIAPWFGITPSEEKGIARSYPLLYGLQKRCMLQKWKNRKGNDATYRALVDIFTQAGKVAVAHRIRDEIVEVRGQVPEVAIQQLQPTTARSAEAGREGITYALESEERPLTKPSNTLASDSYSSHSARPQCHKKTSAEWYKNGVKKSDHEEGMEQSEDLSLVCKVAADVINTTASIAGLLGAVLILAVLGLTVAAEATIGETIVDEAAIIGVAVGIIISGIAIMGVAVGTIIGKFIISSTTIFGVTITGGAVARTIIAGFAIITAALGTIGVSMVHVGGIFLGTAAIHSTVKGVIYGGLFNRMLIKGDVPNEIVGSIIITSIFINVSQGASTNITSRYVTILAFPFISAISGVIAGAFIGRAPITIGEHGAFISGFTIIIAAAITGIAAGINNTRLMKLIICNCIAEVGAYINGVMIGTHTLGSLAGGALTGQKVIRSKIAIDSVIAGAIIGSDVLLPMLPSVGFPVGATLGGSIGMMVAGGIRALANWRTSRNSS